MKVLNCFLPSLLASIATCHLAEAVTIVSVSGPSPSGGPAISAAAGGQFASVCWTQRSTYTNVSITVPIYLFTGSSIPNPTGIYHGTAYVTTTIGPGTTTAIASTAFTGTNTSPKTTELFSGLTLGPGFYCLTLAGSDQEPPGPGGGAGRVHLERGEFDSPVCNGVGGDGGNGGSSGGSHLRADMRQFCVSPGLSIGSDFH